MYSALTVAKHIISRCNETQRTVSNLKLQKLLYFVQAEFLVSTGKACFPEEIEAWDFGPVVPIVYHKYKAYGSANIPYVDENEYHTIMAQDRELMNGIIDECAKFSASTLVQITHNQAPWLDAYKNGLRVITKESIRSFFMEG